MDISPIGNDRIQSMLSQLRAVGSQAAQSPAIARPVDLLNASSVTKLSSPSTQVDFSAVLKSSLAQISQYQNKSDELGKNFALGDDSVGLSDVMIASQKASIALQSAVQIRNKLVSAYQNIMNMQV